MGTDAKDDILSDEVFEKIYEDEDIASRERKLFSLRNKAKEEGRVKEFDALRKAYDQIIRSQVMREREEKKTALKNRSVGLTDFSDPPYGNIICGSWRANDFGISTYNYNNFEETWACPHPILPVERLRNIETGIEQMKIAFKRDNRWTEIIVQKDVLSSASKIVALSNRGILVTSETARNLVKYLSDVESFNEGQIPVQRSSSKFGWNQGLFLPYDTDIIFDGDARFYQLSEALNEHGSYAVWLEAMRKIRQSGRFEVQFMMSASFASVLLKGLGLLPFIVDLWGDTEGGKTVTEMLAASIWADPGEGKYIGDFKTTDVALEAKANALNSLPLILDDTSKVSKKIADNFEGFIYDIASGKGKSRSDKELGIRYENNWNLVALTTGEAPLSGYANQGGAINRILEVKCSTKLFDDPHWAADTVKMHYGFAGRRFIECIKEMSKERLMELFEAQRKRIDEASISKMQKQLLSLAAVLTADQIATDVIFCDGICLDLNRAIETLSDPDEISVNERAYRFLLDKIAMNQSRFSPRDEHVEQWGVTDGYYAYFYPAAFSLLCEQGNFSKKSFLDWGVRHGKVERDSNGNPSKLKKINGKASRYIWLKLENEGEEAFFD